MGVKLGLTLREKHRPRAFENGVMRRIVGPKWHEVKGEWRKLHIEEPRNLDSSPNSAWVIQIKKNEIGEACGTYGVERRCIEQYSCGNPIQETTWES
jgi:hypothetical protein